MAKFRFRLATLQKLREIQRDELRSKLAEAVQAHQILEEELAHVTTDIANLQAMRRQAVTSGQVNVEPLLEAQRYHGVLLAQQATMQEQTRLLTAEVERRRVAVVEADRQVKVLEKLHERKLDEFRQDQQRAEVKVLDEVAARCGGEVNPWLA
ncbi:MAG: flagellar export protein FliJ [Bythopirellula sp.]|nr:flagellar export protein FliJ [Bythopirellula sp.]